MATNVAPIGMYFTVTISPQGLGLVAQNFTDNLAGGGAQPNAETPYPADMQLCCTGVPAGTTPATVATSILANVSIPFGGPGLHWKVAYASIGSALVATCW